MHHQQQRRHLAPAPPPNPSASSTAGRKQSATWNRAGTSRIIQTPPARAVTVNFPPGTSWPCSSSVAAVSVTPLTIGVIAPARITRTATEHSSCVPAGPFITASGKSPTCCWSPPQCPYRAAAPAASTAAPPLPTPSSFRKPIQPIALVSSFSPAAANRPATPDHPATITPQAPFIAHFPSAGTIPGSARIHPLARRI